MGLDPGSEAVGLEPGSEAVGLEPGSKAVGLEPGSEAVCFDPGSEAMGLESDLHAIYNLVSQAPSSSHSLIPRIQVHSLISWL